jgi:hypothetical protein
MSHNNTYRFNTAVNSCTSLRGVVSYILFVCIMLVNSSTGFSQPFAAYNKVTDTIYKSTGSAHEPTNTEYDEVLITLNVPRIGSIEIPAIVYQETIYLPVKELFDYLKIKNTISSDLRSVNGFFINPAATYSINKSWNQIIYEAKKYELQPSDIVVTESNLYLKSGLFGQVFGLDCKFNFRSLTVNLLTTIELPALREMKLETMHKNMSQLKNEKKADTTIKRTFSLLRLGMLDWSVISTREMKNQTNTRITVGMGATIAGGEANMFLNYYNDRPFKLREQYYFWRNVNNENKVLRQVVLGKILANPSSTIYNGITGIQLNNTPTTFRRSFGTYTLSDRTEPEWMVELYVNNVLVNYTKADASGFFTFEVPMVYGNSVVKLRFYGPWGEEKFREQNLSIPFNFLPQHQFEYSLSTGVVDDNKKSKFSRAQLSYGLNKRITVGGGMEYLSSVSGRVMPFVNTSIRLGSGLFINAEHIQGVRSNAVISYKLPSNLRIELNYLHFDKDQKAIKINYLEEKKLVISKPFRGKKYSAFSRLSINQFTLSNNPKKTKYTSAEFLVSAVAFGISSNLTSYAVINDKGVPLAYTNLSTTFRFPHGIHILPQVQYEYNRKKISFVKAEVEKSVFNRGFLNISYEWDLKNNNYIAGIGVRYNFSFAQTAVSTRRTKQSTTTMETVRGSLLYDSKTNFMGLSNQNNVGKGGLIISPYLDLNCNNKRDVNEPSAPGLKIKINGGRIQRNEKDTTIRVTGLDAYTSYYLELDKNSFDNIAWQIKKSTIRINIDPNHFTFLEVPVAVVGEVTGTVYLNGKKGAGGLGRIIVNIYNSDSTLAARTVTEADGFFSYLGLPPGSYFIKIDAEQLKKLKMQSSSDFLPALLKKSKDGAAVNGLVFILSSTDLNME